MWLVGFKQTIMLSEGAESLISVIGEGTSEIVSKIFSCRTYRVL